MTRYGGLLCALAFFLLASLWINTPGLEDDEALFGTALYQPVIVRYQIDIAGHHVPLMIMDYLGTLKSCLFWPVFRLFGPSIASVRLPAILLGAFSLFLFHRFARHVWSERVAVYSSVLLATDATFLITTRNDWGPTALQHALLAASLLLIRRLYLTRSLGAALAAGLLVGLGFWNKATFLWPCAGLAIGAIVAAPRQVREMLQPKLVLTFLLAVAIGAAPLILFNVAADWPTLRSRDAAPSLDGLSQKVANTRSALAGTWATCWLSRCDPEDPLLPRVLNIGSVRVYLFLACLLMLPWAGRTWRFCAVSLAVAWIVMAIVRGGGGSAHHVVLLWPLPHWLAANVLAHQRPRLAAVVLALAAAAGLLVIGDQYRQLRANGGGPMWNDARSRVHTVLARLNPKEVYLMDWGLMSTLRLLGAGKVPLNQGYDATEPKRIAWIAAQPGAIYVACRKGFEIMEGANERFLAAARELGYEPRYIEVVRDSHHREVIDLYRLVSARK